MSGRHRRRALVIGSALLFLADAGLNITAGLTGLACSAWLSLLHSFCMGVAFAWLCAVYVHLRVTGAW